MPQRDAKGRFVSKKTQPIQPQEHPVDEYHRQQASDPEMRPVDRMRDEPVKYQEVGTEERLPPVREERRRPPTSRPTYEPDDDYSFGGCLQFLIVLLLLAVIGWLIWDKVSDSRSPDPPAPIPAPIPGPVIDLRSYTEPIRLKLAADPTKAARVHEVYVGFRDALLGPSGARVTDSQVLERVQSSLLTDLNTKGGTPVGAEIDQAIGGYLGMLKSVGKDGTSGWEPKTFDDADRAKLAQIIGAIAQAAGAAK